MVHFSPLTACMDLTARCLSAIKERCPKAKFNPLTACLVMIVLMAGLHLYQMKLNPCYHSLRLHVVANSDSPEDQAVKLKVRDAVLKTAGPLLRDARNQEEAASRVQKLLPIIQQAANITLKAEGYHYTARVYLGTYEFPVRWYGETVFPPGRYQAVRVVLGEGRGHNWWCVLFPPLCLPAAESHNQSRIMPADSIPYSRPAGEIEKRGTAGSPVTLRMKTLDWLRGLYRGRQGLADAEASGQF